uniref:Uncharacterized protein n=1 Tax=Strigamia maritima TaxID=126957 RepID=T1IT61_STRMM
MWTTIKSVGISQFKWWSMKPIWFIVYRLLIAAYVTTHLCLRAIYSMQIYNQIIVAKVPTILKISWVFTNLSTSTSILITAVYWIFLYPDGTSTLDYGNIQIHAINSVVIVLDLIIISIPFRLFHFYQPLLFGLSYLIFNLIYWIITNEVIYSILDWQKVTKSSIFVIVMLFFGILFHLLAFILNEREFFIQSLTVALIFSWKNTVVENNRFRAMIPGHLLKALKLPR